MIPILIRSKDRPFYLNTTLTSLTATNLEDALIVIVDDCSETDLMKEYLFTDNNINLPDFSWYDEIEKEVTTEGHIIRDSEHLSNKEIWNKYIGDIPINLNITGIKEKFNIISPTSNKGDVGGLFWTIYLGFSLFKNADKIIVLEDDLIFHKNWLKNALTIYNNEKYSKVGCVSVYNREIENNSRKQNLSTYFENPNIGGVMYLIPRTTFDIMKNDKLFQINYGQDEIGGDVKFQNYLASKDLRILNSTESYIQHIGIKSITRPGRFLRYSKNFLKPFAWNKYF